MISRLSSRKPLYKEIENEGFNNMPQKEKTKIIRSLLKQIFQRDYFVEAGRILVSLKTIGGDEHRQYCF